MILVGVTLLILLALGNYLASIFFSLLVDHSLKYVSVTQFIIRYYWYYNSPEYGRLFHMAAIAGFSIPFMAVIGIWYRLKRPKKQSPYGEVRFASYADIERQGLFQENTTSIIIGKCDDLYALFNGQQFPMLVAPAHSDKSMGTVIPNLLAYKDSVVVLDMNLKAHAVTSKYRQVCSQDVYVFNPFADDQKSHRWNPLGDISDDPYLRIADLNTIAAVLYPIDEESSIDQFLPNQARQLFLALVLYLFEKRVYEMRLIYVKPQPTLGMLYRLCNEARPDVRAFLTNLTTSIFLSQQTKQMFSGVLTQPDEKLSKILDAVKGPLTPWQQAILDAATSENDFLLTDVRKKRMAIYVGVQPDKLTQSRLIIQLFFTQLIALNTKELPQTNSALKYQCLILMDEFDSIGRINALAQSPSSMADYNMRLFPIIQSATQLDALYGKKISRAFIAQHVLKILYTPATEQDAQDYSEMLGLERTKKSRFSKIIGWRKNNEGLDNGPRMLMQPQALKAIPQDREIFCFEGLDKPVICEKIRYHEDPVFKVRLMGKSEVPTLNIKRDSWRV